MEESFFRFPLYLSVREDYVPPLSAEEKQLRTAQKGIFACDFEPSAKILKRLKKSDNICIRVASLAFLCLYASMTDRQAEFRQDYHLLHSVFAGDFPHKKDMEVFLTWVYVVLTQIERASDSLHIQPDYPYSPDVYPMIAFLSMYHILDDACHKIPKVRVDLYEILCQQVYNDGYCYEACEMHFILFVAHYVGKSDKAHKTALYHLKTGLDIAYRYQYTLIPAQYAEYYQEAFRQIAADYPAAFMDTVKQNATVIYKNYAKFMEEMSFTRLYSHLTPKEYTLFAYAVNGLTYKEVAKALHLSERTVAAKYGEIYRKLGVKTRQEMVGMMMYEMGELDEVREE